MATIRFLDSEQVDRCASLATRRASIGSAADSPQRRHHYEGVGDLVELAATLIVEVNRIHPLVDGNKRASVRLCDEFLGLNGHRLEGTPEALAAFVWRIARERDREAAAAGLRELVVAGAPDRPFDERYPSVIEDLAR